MSQAVGMGVASPSRLTIHELQPLLSSGALRPRDLLEDLLARIEQRNPALHAYLGVEADRLREQVARVERRPGQGRLYGIPVTVKANLCVTGEETTCGSRILAGFRPPYDATVISRLRDEGALLIPGANMDEFAFGSSTETSAWGITRNPWAPDRVPGGSSGGSAAAVAADLGVAALGSDTGGSIRQPASFCGVVGLKPTYGRVSRYGLIAFASSLDQIGPLTKDVTDCALVLSVLAGHDPLDSTSAPVEVPDYLGATRRPVKGLRIGIPDRLLSEGLDADVREAMEEAGRVCERLGMVREPIDLPHATHAVATYYIIATAEASSNLARYDGVQYGARARGFMPRQLLEMEIATRTQGFGDEAKRRVLLGTYVLSHGYYDAYYLKGLRVRTLIKQDYDRAFERCDVMMMPTSPTPAFRIGEKLNDPLQMYLSDVFTISANLAGLPAISVPCGFSRAGLPIGLQLLGPAFREDVILRAAYAYEQATDWHRRRPDGAAEAP